MLINGKRNSVTRSPKKARSVRAVFVEAVNKEVIVCKKVKHTKRKPGNNSD